MQKCCQSSRPQRSQHVCSCCWLPFIMYSSNLKLWHVVLRVGTRAFPLQSVLSGRSSGETTRRRSQWWCWFSAVLPFAPWNSSSMSRANAVLMLAVGQEFCLGTTGKKAKLGHCSLLASKFTDSNWWNIPSFFKPWECGVRFWTEVMLSTSVVWEVLLLLKTKSKV